MSRPSAARTHASRASRALLLFALGSVLALSATTVLAQLDTTQQPDVANSRYNFSGVINSNAVQIRSGPGENYYPTARLDKGATVTVVGMKFDWLKVVPPEGSFCYVAKAYVERHGEGGKRGRVTKPDLNVRAGSALNPMKTTVQTKLNEGEQVTILGEQDEYFKISPPASAYLYVNKQFVDPVRPVANQGSVVRGQGSGEDHGTARTPNPAPVPPLPVPATQPTAVEATDVVFLPPPAPATQSAEQVAAETSFERQEALFASVADKSIEEQPLDQMLAEFEKLAANNALAASMRRIAEFRVATLKVRQEARRELAAARKAQEEAAAKRLAAQAEREELVQRIQQNDVKVFAAVGTLRASSLQLGPTGQTLYRLTDPGTGRTLVYIRSADPGYVSMLNQFVGVRGDTVVEQQLRVIIPTATEAVDPAKLHSSVTAHLIPPTMMPKVPTASAGN